MGLLLVANPGSSSRKYALFNQDSKELSLVATLNIESTASGLLATLRLNSGDTRDVPLDFTDIAQSANHAETLMRRGGVLAENQSLTSIAMRVVAPGSYFMYDHLVDDEFMQKLHEAKELAPIHVENVLNEISLLRQIYPNAAIVGVSDSAFHITKPSYAWNYGINLKHADAYDIKRFGYHGLSVSAAIDTVWGMGKLPPKVVVCHLGSGSSITAVFHGRSVDNTMGYSPLEGVLMATRSGSIDPVAVKVLGKKLGKSLEEMEDYLNHQGGLGGLAGSNDIRELIKREANGDHIAHLGLTTLVHTYQKGIGSMMAALGGADMIIFTGTVGERSAILRKRIIAHFQYADFLLDGDLNEACLNPKNPTFISRRAQSKPIVVIPANEALQIAKKAANLL